MKLITWKNEWLPLLMITIMIVAGIVTYPMLPERLPVHWNIEGNVDGYLPKSPLAAMAIPALTIGMWVLFLMLPRFDPKKEKYEMFARGYRVIEQVTIAFMVFLYSFTILSSVGCRIPMEKVVPGGIGILFIILGNLMGKIRQNYFVGFKLPWTLANEQVWNKTHQLGGKLMVVVGILLLIGLAFSPMVEAIMLIGGITVMIVVTVLYSYMIYRKNV